MTGLPRDNSDSPRKEVYALADALLSNTITAEEAERLGELVCNDAEARRHYVCFMHDSAVLHQWSSRISVAEESGVEADWLGEMAFGSCELFAEPADAPFPSIIIDPSPAASPSVFSLNSPFGGMMFSYLMSALFVCLGMLIGLTWKVSEPRGVVDAHAPATDVRTASLSPSSPKMVLVGRITGLVDCTFSDDKDILPPPGFAHVPLGRKYKLVSGLMEITYDTGAKVILQGPVTYEVESASGGFLSLGKLTARVERRGERGEFSAIRQSVNQQLHSPLSPLFFVRTPAAVVTDLGTEFGVEVNDEGGVRSEVFRGSVKVQLVGGDDKLQQDEVTLDENESVLVKKSAGEDHRRGAEIRRVAPDSNNFVRQLPKQKKSLPLHVLAYFRMGEDDPDAVTGKPAGRQTFNRGHNRQLQKHGSPTYANDTAAPGSTLAMNFTGEELEYFAGKDLYLTVTEGFILEAWVRVHVIPQQGFLTLVFNGNTDINGYGLLLHEGRWKYLFAPGAIGDSGVKCIADQWTHLALVSESGKVRLWVNGRSVGAIYEGPTNIPIGSFTIGGNANVLSEPPFEGQIDEVRLSVFQGQFQPKMLLLPENQALHDKGDDAAKKEKNLESANRTLTKYTRSN